MKKIIISLLTLFSVYTFAQFSVDKFAKSGSWDELKLKEYWEKNGANEIEGIYIRTDDWKVYNLGSLTQRVKSLNINSFYVVKYGDYYELGSLTGNKDFYGKIYIHNNKLITIKTSGRQYVSNDRVGEMRAIIKMIDHNNFQIDNMYARINIDFYTEINDLYTKTYSPSINSSNNKKSISISGTGFGISSNGVIVTNFHVIDGSKTIKVRGIDSDFNKIYRAKLLVSDKNNDLAIIQIEDNTFTSLGTIPFTIKNGISSVGESIFVLGYPLRSTMGDEIKLTNGIISSRTGFQGDITSYQISAPVQPGNSGGPLFDSQGNLIGIINAKHAGAENASYGVKSSYLSNLIELLPIFPKLQTVNLLTGKTLTQQVELAKKFVYIIEIE